MKDNWITISLLIVVICLLGIVAYRQENNQLIGSGPYDLRGITGLHDSRPWVNMQMDIDSVHIEGTLIYDSPSPTCPCVHVVINDDPHLISNSSGWVTVRIPSSLLLDNDWWNDYWDDWLEEREE